MARNTRTFADIDLNFIPNQMHLVTNTGIGLLTTSTNSNIVKGTRIWTALTDVTVGQEFFWNYYLYRVTKAGTTGKTGLTNTILNRSEINGDAIFLNVGDRPSDAAVTNFERYDMSYRNLYCNGLFIGKVKSTIDKYNLELYTNARHTVDQQPFTYTNPADLVRRYDENSIKAAVKNLVLTNNYERPFHPELGSQVNNLLFEPASPLLKAVLERAIHQLIDNFEPRVNLTGVGVQVNPDNNSVNVTINYTILSTQTPQFLNLVLERTR